MSFSQNEGGGPWRETLPVGGREAFSQEFDLSLLTPCEFCNRTFVPTSLNKHRRGCYNAWIKQKDRDSKMDREKNRYQTPVGYNGEKPILTIEQMLAKRRQRRLNWRLRHEEFMRAVHAARDYADAVASGNPLPPPPPPVLEPDLKQCPHCQRRFHEKAIERHLTRCREQSIRNNKERPSYQSMEAKRRLAVRLYYQPTSRPNSCLSMTNPPSSMSFSRPSSRQTDYDYSRNTDSPSDCNMGRYSSLSAIENNESKFKIPDSIFNNQVKSHGRQTPRTKLKDNHSRNSTPAFDTRNSTPIIPDNYLSGRHSNLSTFSTRNQRRQSPVHTPIDTQSSLNKRSVSLKKNEIYGPGGNLKRSTSCLSQSRGTSIMKADKFAAPKIISKDIRGNGDTRKPFSCGRSSSKESINKTESLNIINKMNRSNESINSLFKTSTRSGKCDKFFINQISSSITERKKSVINRNDIPGFDLDKKILQNKNSKGDQIKPRRTRNESPVVESRPRTVLENNLSDREKMEIKKVKHRSKPVKSNVDFNTLKISQMSKIMAGNVETKSKENLSECTNTNRMRNEVQIRIQPFVRSDICDKKEVIDITAKVPNVVKLKSNISALKENENCITICHKIDSKGENPNSSKDSKLFFSNCNITKAQGDNTCIQSQSAKTNKKENNLSSNSVTKNLYQCKSIRSVSISDQNNTTKYRSSISLQDSLNRCEDNNIIRSSKSKEVTYFCQDCGHKFPSRDAKFCCSCGCRRSEMAVNKGNGCQTLT